MGKLVRKAIIVFSVLLFTIVTLAQQPPDGEQSKSKFGPRKQLATIIFCGLGGAVLGLSTLSFYGRPQDKLANIGIGFGVGIIAGTVFTVYGAATNPKDFYGTGYKFPNENPSYATTRGMQDSINGAQSTSTLGYNYTF